MKYLRLKKQADFQRLFQKGKRAFSPSLTVLYRPSQNMTMGISVGKKQASRFMRLAFFVIKKEHLIQARRKLLIRQSYLLLFYTLLRQEKAQLSSRAAEGFPEDEKLNEGSPIPNHLQI